MIPILNLVKKVVVEVLIVEEEDEGFVDVEEVVVVVIEEDIVVEEVVVVDIIRITKLCRLWMCVGGETYECDEQQQSQKRMMFQWRL